MLLKQAASMQWCRQGVCVCAFSERSVLLVCTAPDEQHWQSNEHMQTDAAAVVNCTKAREHQPSAGQQPLLAPLS